MGPFLRLLSSEPCAAKASGRVPDPLRTRWLKPGGSHSPSSTPGPTWRRGSRQHGCRHGDVGPTPGDVTFCIPKVYHETASRASPRVGRFQGGECADDGALLPARDCHGRRRILPLAPESVPRATSQPAHARDWLKSRACPSAQRDRRRHQPTPGASPAMSQACVMPAGDAICAPVELELMPTQPTSIAFDAAVVSSGARLTPDAADVVVGPRPMAAIRDRPRRSGRCRRRSDRRSERPGVGKRPARTRHMVEAVDLGVRDARDRCDRRPPDGCATRRDGPTVERQTRHEDVTRRGPRRLVDRDRVVAEPLTTVLTAARLDGPAVGLASARGSGSATDSARRTGLGDGLGLGLGDGLRPRASATDPDSDLGSARGSDSLGEGLGDGLGFLGSTRLGDGLGLGLDSGFARLAWRRTGARRGGSSRRRLRRRRGHHAGHAVWADIQLRIARSYAIGAGRRDRRCIGERGPLTSSRARRHHDGIS